MSTDRGYFLLFLLIVPLVMMGQFATEIYLPSIPHMARYFNTEIHIIQLSIAIYVLGFAIGGLFYGVLSDIYGRVPVMLVSLCVAAIGGIVCVAAFHIHALYIGRFIQGLGFSGTAVICRSICRDIATDTEHLSKIGSIIGMSTAIAVAFAPIIGGFIQAYLFWRASFIVLLIFTLLLLFFTWFRLPETNQNIGNLKLKQIFTIYCKILTDKEFLRYNLISGATLGGVIAYQTISSSLLQVKVGLTPQQFGFTSVFITLSFIIGGYANSLLVVRRGYKKMMRAGFYLFLLSSILYTVFGLFGYISVFSVMFSAICFMLGASIVYPNASTGSMSLYANSAGAAASIYNFIQMLCGALGSALVSLSSEANQLNLAILYIGISVLCFFLSKKDNNAVYNN